MPLTDPYLKTSRAKEHLENLRKELEIFYESKPYRFVRQDDVENQRHIVRMETTDTPDRISLIAGDLFYCLRSALDQLVWSLAKLSIPYPEGTQFPILEQSDARRFRMQTNGAPADAVAIIESLQPYHAPDVAMVRGHLLWRLNKMCNIDKHSRIPVHGSTGTLILPRSIIVSMDRGLNYAGVVNIPLSLKSEMALDPSVPEFKVVFGDAYWGIECDIADIDVMYEFVANNLIPRFARFFE
jgi:hypothetical protein